MWRAMPPALRSLSRDLVYFLTAQANPSGPFPVAIRPVTESVFRSTTAFAVRAHCNVGARSIRHGLFHRRSSTEEKTGASSRRVASLQYNSASSLARNKDSASGLALRIKES